MRVLSVFVMLWVMQVIVAEQGPPISALFPPPPSPDFFSNKFCFDGTLRGECLEIIINQICRDGNYTPNLAKLDYQDSGEFSCQGMDCHIGTLSSQYCRPNASPTTPSPSADQDEMSPRLHMGGNNVVGACARLKNDTYTVVERVAGKNCKEKLKRICFDCPPPGLPKKILLERMLLDSYKKLKDIDDPKGFVKAVPAKSTDRNYPREH
ncbi:uncharacterized protein [Palaemon carinicauda]|uniref:uncharacterized protein isoform X2 n=1 Tax=Palaemon carinicauda TaxID=392227 RepID=UPI0035B5F462